MYEIDVLLLILFLFLVSIVSRNVGFNCFIFITFLHLYRDTRT